MREVSLRCAFTVLVAVWLVACGGGRSAVLERLDERAGAVIARARVPLVFARTEARYSRSARDYLYVGPVETNRQGVREYYLWVGVATTLDRGFIAPAASTPQTLVITVADEPIELPLAPWGELVRTSGGGPVYATAVPVRAELAARVSLQQLALFDRQPLAAVAVVTAGQGAPSRYARWGEGGGFGEFVTTRLPGP